MVKAIRVARSNTSCLRSNHLMPRRLLKIVSNSLSREPSRQSPTFTFALEDVVWAMGSFCALNRKPFDAELLAKQFPPPYTSDSFIHAARALGFRIKRRDCDSTALSSLNLPCLVVLKEVVSESGSSVAVRPELVEACPELVEVGQGLPGHVVRQAHHERSNEQPSQQIGTVAAADQGATAEAASIPPVEPASRTAQIPSRHRRADDCRERDPVRGRYQHPQDHDASGIRHAFRRDSLPTGT